MDGRVGGRGIAGVEKRGEDRRRERKRGGERRCRELLGEIVQGQIDKGVL